MLDRLRRQIRISRDAALDTLLNELSNYPLNSSEQQNGSEGHSANEVALPLRLKTPNGDLSFLSTVTVFGTPIEIELSEVTLEAFYPADEKTAQALGIGR
uniref:hypothetical protein n=1 Tax=Occallatibacter riparius TaxID=1002689 RepID=UPI0036F1BBC9